MHFYQKYIEDFFEIIELSNPQITVQIAVNIGNSLFSIKKNDVEKIYFPFTLGDYKTNTKTAGIPFLHPWANRLEGDFITIENNQYHFPKNQLHLIHRDGNNLPLHGLLLKADQWQTTELHEDENTCFHVAEFMFDDASFLSIFPFKHKIFIKHILQNNELTIETTILNLDEKLMPISFGFHPYFNKEKNTAQLTLPVVNAIEVNEKMIPTGKEIAKEKKWDFVYDKISLEKNIFDDGFCKLKRDENQQGVFSLNDIQILADENFPIVQVYAPVDKPCVCIEPMTAKTNALNTNGCSTIKMNEKFTARFSIAL